MSAGGIGDVLSTVFLGPKAKAPKIPKAPPPPAKLPEEASPAESAQAPATLEDLIIGGGQAGTRGRSRQTIPRDRNLPGGSGTNFPTG